MSKCGLLLGRLELERTMKKANVTLTENLNYKGGFVECACGWRKELGNGFNGYYIANCPSCTLELDTRTQRKTCSGRPRNLTIKLGRFTYFALSNGIHVQFKAQVRRVEYGRSMHRYDAL